MAKTGLQNENTINELLRSGSSAVKSKNEFGVHFFEQTNLEDGVVGARLTKPKYDDNELVKAIDTNIFELIPRVEPELPPMVLKSLYDEALRTIDSLNFNIEQLLVTQSLLSSKIIELNTFTQSLLVDNDNEKLKAAVAQNTTQTVTFRIQSSVLDLQNAIQKATAEAITRVSLQARNESLFQENALLKDQLFGKQAAIQEGAVVAEDFAIKIKTSDEPGIKGLLYYARGVASNGYGWINGPEVEIENFTPNAITISVLISSDILNPERNTSNTESASSLLSSISDFTIPANGKATKTLAFQGGANSDKAKLNKLRPNAGGNDRKYESSITFTSSASGDGINIPITFRKQTGNRFTG
jgi:hypothetical protein